MVPERTDVLYGSLGLIVLKTLEAPDPLHGYRLARRIEQISGNQRAGRSQLQKEEAQWQRATGINDRFFRIAENAS